MGAQNAEKNQKFEAVYNAFADEVYRFVYSRVGFDAPAAEDLTQDIFLEVLRGMGGFRGLSSERTWVFGIARHRLCDYYRRQYRAASECLSLDDDGLSELPSGEAETMLKSLEDGAVRQCLHSLPKPYQIALTLKYLDDCSTKDIARLTGRTPKAVEGILRRARAAFIESYLQTEGEGK